VVSRRVRLALLNGSAFVALVAAMAAPAKWG
jgi:hypothetical protein